MRGPSVNGEQPLEQFGQMTYGRIRKALWLVLLLETAAVSHGLTSSAPRGATLLPHTWEKDHPNRAALTLRA